MNELDYLIGQYQERIQMLGEALTYGQCKDFEEYRYTCGQVRGLEAACAIIKDLKDRLENSDNE
jgi:hypothetical protein